MKTINILALIILLSGCTTVGKYWPKPHDPALAQGYVTVKVDLDQADCNFKTDVVWAQARKDAVWLREYATFRSDPQLESVAAVVENLDKAQETQSIKACEIWLGLSKQRLTVLNRAWSGR